MTAKDWAVSESVYPHSLLDIVGTELESPLVLAREWRAAKALANCLIGKIGSGTLISCSEAAWIYLTCSAWRKLGIAQCSHGLNIRILSWRALWVWSCSASFARLRCANPKQLGWNLWVCSCIRQVWEGPTWSSVGQIREKLVGAHWSGVQVYVLYYSNKNSVSHYKRRGMFR